MHCNVILRSSGVLVFFLSVTKVPFNKAENSRPHAENKDGAFPDPFFDCKVKVKNMFPVLS